MLAAPWEKRGTAKAEFGVVKDAGRAVEGFGAYSQAQSNGKDVRCQNSEFRLQNLETLVGVAVVSEFRILYSDI